MVTFSYSQVKKLDEHQELKPFNSYRAVGLAVEVGHAFCKEKGLGKLLAEEGMQALRKVELSGPNLQVADSAGRFRKVRRCDLELLREDAAFVQAMVQQHRGIAADLRFNFWEVDKKMKNRLGHFDFLGDFSTVKQNWGVKGTLWVEMKVMKDGVFVDDKLEEKRLALEEKLPRVVQAHPEVEWVLLLVTMAQKDGRSWSKPFTLVELYKLGARSGDWKTLAGGASKKAGRGRAKKKPGLQELWDTLPSEKIDGQQCFYVADFLLKLGLKKDSIKKRMPAFNAMIAEEDPEADELFQRKMPNKTGLPPWFGNRPALRALYTAL